jgi:4-azaleucine resistance transporter AzlC
MPIFLGYAPVGAAFGVLARSTGFSVGSATLCSATALAGAGQFIAVSLLAGGASVAAVLIATAIVNLRYVLFAATLSPHLSHARLPALSWLGFTLTDETFAVNIAEHRKGAGSVASMAGVGAIAWAGWVSGTAAGAAATSWIGDPTRFGVEFAMPAMFSALFVALAENRAHVIVGLSAGLIALALPALTSIGIVVPASWYVVIASIGAATVASLVVPDE